MMKTLARAFMLLAILYLIAGCGGEKATLTPEPTPTPKLPKGCSPKCSEADLSDFDLCGFDLAGADLIGAYLRGTDLVGADLRGADLSDAALRDVNLAQADLRGAILDTNAQMPPRWRLVWEIVNQGGANRNLSGADLSGAGLRGPI